MIVQLIQPKQAVNLTAGIVGLLYEWLGGGKPAENGRAAGSGADDLTRIDGIGPTFARRLNEAGVTTFAHLAALTPDKVREITGVASWQSDPLDWIIEARLLKG